MKRTIARRKAPEVNAGSMADIAFLLLIFFLVTTTILSEEGILVRLPPWTIELEDITVKKRNLMQVYLNADDRIQMRDREVQLDEVRGIVKEFIANPERQSHLAEASNKALVSLINDRGTSFEQYLMLYNELKGAYTELWQEAAQRRYGMDYEQLPLAHQKSIRQEIPQVISEAEPTDHANNIY